jgi:hypothetical protein
VGPEIEVNTRFPLVPPDGRIITHQPAVAADEAGTFVVAWQRYSYRSYDRDTGYYGNYDRHIRTRRFDASGNRLEQESVANTLWHPRNGRVSPSIASRQPGRFIVAWWGAAESLRQTGVFARSPDVIFSDGTSMATLAGLDNDERAVDLVRMGALSVKDGASGALYFDEFVSRRLAKAGLRSAASPPSTRRWRA